MNLNFYLAQLSSTLAWIVLIISYWKNKDNKLLYLQIITCIFFSLSNILLGAYTGLFVVLFEIIRDYLYIKLEDDKKTFLITLPIYIVIGIFSYNKIWSLFAIFASINDGYALIYKGKKVVLLGIVTYTLWLIYDFSYKNYANVLAEIIVIISNLTILISGKTILKREITTRR